MSRLFVGQRVRILYSMGWPELAGEEGRIISRSNTCGIEGGSEWYVAPDCWGTYRAPSPSQTGAVIFAPNSSQLEPILPDGAAPANVSFERLMEQCREGTVPAEP